MAPGIAAVVFDLDGVIIESEQVWDRVRHGFVDANGGAWRTDSSRHMMGMSTRAWAAYLVHELGVRLTVEETASRVIADMGRAYEEHLPLISGAVAAVRALSEHWPLGLASGSPPELIRQVLHGAGLDQAFRVVVSSDEVRSGKPAPDVYIRAARRLGVRSESCAIIEDSRNGILAGVAAGGRVIAIPNKAFPLDEQVLSLATTVVSDIGDLSPHVINGLCESVHGRRGP